MFTETNSTMYFNSKIVTTEENDVIVDTEENADVIKNTTDESDVIMNTTGDSDVIMSSKAGVMLTRPLLKEITSCPQLKKLMS